MQRIEEGGAELPLLCATASLRLGHFAVLTVPRTVIHYRSDLCEEALRDVEGAVPYGDE